MRIFNADIQSWQWSLPKWYIYQKFVKSDEKNEVIISTQNTDEWAPGLIRKCIKYHRKYKYWSLTKPGTLSGENLKLFVNYVTLHSKWLSLLLLWCLFILNFMNLSWQGTLPVDFFQNDNNRSCPNVFNASINFWLKPHVKPMLASSIILTTQNLNCY